MPVIPELAVPDPAAACTLLADVFGFQPDNGLMRLASQTVAVVAGPPSEHGVIDHLALAVPDLAGSARTLLARGAQLDRQVTPDGPLEIPEFWTAGVRYLFLQGPAGARIELIVNQGAPQGPGHDHIGIPCSDIAASAAFFAGLGATPLAAVTLQRAEGATHVRFLALQGSVIELYQPPHPKPVPAQGLWRCLRIDGAAPASGPDGVTICPA